jgi:hypothetical protein
MKIIGHSRRFGDFEDANGVVASTFRRNTEHQVRFCAVRWRFVGALRYNCRRRSEKLGVAGGSALATAHEGWESSNASATITALANTTTSVAFYERATRTM